MLFTFSDGSTELLEIAGNATGDNITPLHLLNIKRLAWAIRPWSQSEVTPVMSHAEGPVSKARISAAVDRYLNGTKAAPAPSNVAAIVDKFLESKGVIQTCEPCSAPKPAPEAPAPAAAPDAKAKIVRHEKAEFRVAFLANAALQAQGWLQRPDRTWMRTKDVVTFTPSEFAGVHDPQELSPINEPDELYRDSIC